MFPLSFKQYKFTANNYCSAHYSSHAKIEHKFHIMHIKICLKYYGIFVPYTTVASKLQVKLSQNSFHGQKTCQFVTCTKVKQNHLHQSKGYQKWKIRRTFRNNVSREKDLSTRNTLFSSPSGNNVM